MGWKIGYQDEKVVVIPPLEATPDPVETLDGANRRLVFIQVAETKVLRIGSTLTSPRTPRRTATPRSLPFCTAAPLSSTSVNPPTRTGPS